ncbi:TonB-dependent receptor [Niastella yeongjuensis]|uniref:TonB-dependent receptor n=1 Tax=Niastella yeongjuensis TaxID=354355 RepID=A0A1V9F2P3_9BACT|nr:TonB-dependent receptor [Niastella yeongjuensis]OQP52567.1 TonB-dependent receptor [Niastella yeongjuensis]SEP34298.1 TonB-dependent Receptor Plug Domain [Niastella yeongjuensis]
MSKYSRCLAALSLLLMITIAASAQTTISGTVRNSTNKEIIPFATVSIKGSSAGTFTDDKGSFRLTTPHALPLTLVVSSVGFSAKEVAVSSAGTVEIDLEPGTSLGAEVVVSASRVPERILESPVSIERMNVSAIRSSAAPNYYDGVANLKGVDLTTSSLTFRTISTRGFNGSGNLRFNQLVDGMDNQAPGLNFSVGNIIGQTELDVDNVELLQGASSALYGSGGMNGTLLMNSKSPWKYQGLSFQVKQGFMHFNDPAQDNATPYYDWSLRYAKKIGERFAFRISGQFVKADDWQATDYRNLNRNNVFSELKQGDRTSDPNYDGVNVFGDEASASMQAFAQAVRAQVSATPGTAPALAGLDLQIASGRSPQEIAAAWAANPALAPYATYLPFLIPTSSAPNNKYTNTYGTQNVSRTGYNEKDLVDYNTYNVKVSGELRYKISENTEAIFMGNWGTGTTVYTGADRYSIKNLKMGQYKLEVKSKNWFLRGYTIQENSGDAYTATTAAVAINRAWKTDQDWFQQYTGTYGAAVLGILPGAGGIPLPPATAFTTARTVADAGRLLPGTPEYNNALNDAANKSISKGGAKFEDASDMYHFEGQYNFSEHIKFAEVLVGASYRLYSLNSHGTIFADTTGRIGISEVGGYAQVSKWVVDDLLKLTVSGRYDKNENFKGRFTPRATALIKVAKDNSFRLSYQQAYRFPSTQDQWINLKTPASVLIGGMPDFYTFYHFDASPAYTAESIVKYRTTGNQNDLVVADFGTLKPEIANSYEVGYRGLLTKNLLVDAYGYYSRYQDFLGRKAVGRSVGGSTNKQFLLSPFSTDNYSFISNSQDIVKAIGWGVSVNYNLPKGYQFGVNVSGDQLQDVPDTLVTFFNTPKVRFNVTFGNEKVNNSNWGFNILYRWQDEMLWQGTFGTGEVKAFGSLDAQVNYRLQKIKSMIKLGATNLLNKYYTTAFGNPSVGGLYYVSFGYNVF